MNDKSNFQSITMGVPQGSVVAPLLFIILLNDFANSAPCGSILYQYYISMVIYIYGKTYKTVQRLCIKNVVVINVTRQPANFVETLTFQVSTLMQEPNNGSISFIHHF